MLCLGPAVISHRAFAASGLPEILRDDSPFQEFVEYAAYISIAGLVAGALVFSLMTLPLIGIEVRQFFVKQRVEPMRLFLLLIVAPVEWSLILRLVGRH